MYKMFIFVLCFLFFNITNLNSADVYKYDTRTIEVFFKEKYLEFDSKSPLGWVRVINNQDKRKEYNLLDLTNDQIIYLTAVLKEKSKTDVQRFEGKLR